MCQQCRGFRSGRAALTSRGRADRPEPKRMDPRCLCRLCRRVPRPAHGKTDRPRGARPRLSRSHGQSPGLHDRRDQSWGSAKRPAPEMRRYDHRAQRDGKNETVGFHPTSGQNPSPPPHRDSPPAKAKSPAVSSDASLQAMAVTSATFVRVRLQPLRRHAGRASTATRNALCFVIFRVPQRQRFIAQTMSALLKF